jgi:hypothetical protein
MKKLITILIALFYVTALYAPAGITQFVINKPAKMEPYEALWRAVCLVESGNDSLAYNPIEQAYGIAQIRQIRLNDYAKRTGIVYTLEQCYDKEISKSIFMYYCQGDYEDVAKSWNGSGVKTIEYWDKVVLKLTNK